MAGRALLDLLALPERGFRRQDVFAWLAPHRCSSTGGWAPTHGVGAAVARSRRRRRSRPTGTSAWRRIADDDDAQADAVDADRRQPEWRAERLRRDAAHARSLRAFVARPDRRPGRGRGPPPRRWGEHAAWARRHCHELLGGARPARRWPEAERKAADRVDGALDRLAALDEVEGPVGLDVFNRTLALELESDLGRVGRFGEGVLVGPVSMGIGLDLDLVVVLGLAEGTFPAPVRDDSLLPDHEREAAGGELPLRRARVDRQHRELLAALAAAPRRLLGVPRGDLRRSTERVPSRWVLDLAVGSSPATVVVGRRPPRRSTPSGSSTIGSFAAGLRRLDASPPPSRSTACAR